MARQTAWLCIHGCGGQVSMHMDVVDKLLSFIRYGSPFCILYIQAGKNECTCPPMHVVDKFGNVIGDLFANTSQHDAARGIAHLPVQVGPIETGIGVDDGHPGETLWPAEGRPLAGQGPALYFTTTIMLILCILLYF